jgi:L,D-transpeptidase YcbB
VHSEARHPLLGRARRREASRHHPVHGLRAGRRRGVALRLSLSTVALVVTPMLGSVAAQRPGNAVDSLVARFYAQRGARLEWSDSGGVSRDAAELVDALARAGTEGLDPQDYPMDTIDSLLRSGPPPGNVWHLDSLLTQAFFAYGWDVSRGRLAPGAVDPLWTAAPQTMDLVGRLVRSVEAGHTAAVLRSLPPPQPGYVGLRAALARYRAIVARGGWPIIPGAGWLQRGVRGSRVAALRGRLTAEGYAAPADSDADLFDSGLEAAVREFQERHGLTVDGAVGPVTQRALNVSAAARVQQITLNLERWRWLPRFLGERYIEVNSAAFTLAIVDSGQPVLRMRAIVGRPDRPTPIVSSHVTELVFRPSWYVPRTIAARELLPLVQRDRGYLAREGIGVFGDSAAGGRRIDPATVDWSTVTESTFTYQLVQEPGPTNPLGGVKLVFWTPFDVFIHDTPRRPLFTERLRAFSHGCVRVEQAAELATYLLPDWSVDSIHAAMSVGREERVRLHAVIPVYLVYFTAWIDGAGKLEFRGDPYGWDVRLAGALASPRHVFAGRSPEVGCDQGPN